MKLALLLSATAIITIAPPSRAQSAGDGFLFKVPSGAWTVRAGFDHALAGSDIYTFVTDQLTLNKNDFSSATLGTNLAFRLSPATDIVIDFSYARSSQKSEFRDWIDNNNQAIEQTTSLRRMPITLGLRHYFTSRGRSIGRFAWIPARRALYIGVGAGMMEYKFSQVGDFIDFETTRVFYDEYISQAWTPTAHANAGLDIALGRSTMLNLEGRYTWAQAPMSTDFQGFNHIDLSGLAMTAGLSFRL